MKKIALAVSALFLLQACTVQTLFDNLGPKDKTSERIARDISFGEHKRQKLDIYAPKGANGNSPVLMFIYGGGWHNGHKDGYDFAGRALAAQGYVTVIANYRLVPEVVFPTFLEDGAAAIKWINENIDDYGGNPERIYLMGHSAGAYNAVMLAIDEQYLAAENLNRDTIDGVIGVAGPYDFYPYDVSSTINAFGHTKDPVGQTQPIAIIDEYAPPLFLITGTEDKVVRPRNVKALAKVAQEHGVPVKTAFYEGLDHIEPITALSITIRKKAPILNEVKQFIDAIEANQ